MTKEYKNDDITIVWKPDLCIHATNCWKGLIDVFNPEVRPWINPYGATTEKITAQIKECPSAALSYYRNDGNSENKDKKANETAEVEIVKDGPLMVHGDIIIKDCNGKQTERREITAFCRCGSSTNKPYCDGAHTHVNFKG